MPLPDGPLTLTGGCNCRAIRYRIAVPPVSARPLHPNSFPSDPVNLPFIATDHCNDCRRAGGSILPTWLCTPLNTVTACVVPLPAPSSEQQPPSTDTTPDESHDLPGLGPFPAELDDNSILSPNTQNGSHINAATNSRTPYRPASDVFTPESCSASYLTFYEHTPGKRRFFCRRCGTNLAYVPVANYLPGFPAMFDLVLGSLDRKSLEMDGMRPERQLWWDWGVSWIRELSVTGLGWGGEAVRHADYDVGVKVDDVWREIEACKCGGM